MSDQEHIRQCSVLACCVVLLLCVLFSLGNAVAPAAALRVPRCGAAAHARIARFAAAAGHGSVREQTAVQLCHTGAALRVAFNATDARIDAPLASCNAPLYKSVCAWWEGKRGAGAPQIPRPALPGN